MRHLITYLGVDKMKHKIFKTLLAVVAATITYCVEADIHTETVNGIEWTYIVKDGKASLESGGYGGVGMYSAYISPAIPRSTSGAITIPSTLGGYPVTRIDRGAFWGCSSLTSVTIPNSVTVIGEKTFKDCESLRSVNIPKSVTSIGEYAFHDCSYLESVTIPDGVTSIGDDAFNNCRYLTSVTIPNSVTSIGDSAFEGCKSLTSVTIPNSVTSIGDEAFSGCSSLTSVTIPNSVTSIGDEAFKYCSSLTSITIPNSVTSIGDEAFWSCKSLTSVTIPNSVTSIGDEAFKYCSSLTSITIPNSVTSIGREAFPSNCWLITPVENGDKVDKMVEGQNIVEEALTEQKKAELYDSFQTLFGKRIGDTISPYEIERSFYKSGKFHKEYVFTPRKPFLSFNHYIVKVSAQNHVIYSIRATAEYSPGLYKMVKDAIEKKYQVWLHRWRSGGNVKEDRYVWGVKGNLKRLFNLQVVNKGYSGKEIVLEILDKQGEKIAENESLGEAVDAL